MLKTATHIGARVLLIVGVCSFSFALAYTRAEGTGFTFAGGGIDLKVDSQASYNGAAVPAGTWAMKNLVPGVDKFFNFHDIKPGDKGENTISLHSKKDPAWVCLDLVNLKDTENGENEPESIVDTSAPTQGELSSVMEFFAWHDDGDNIFEVGEKPIFGTTTQSAVQTLNNKTYPIADYKNGPAIPKNTTKYFGIYWCAGDLLVNVSAATISCNGSLIGNASQTDAMTVDVKLRAVSAKDEPKFVCKGYIPPPPPGDQCEEDNTNITIINNNSAVINNSSSAVSNTGGNTATGGSVQTGNSSANTSTINIINTSIFNFFKKK